MIRIADLEFAYPGGEYTRRLRELEIESGSRTAIIGPSGCGKTTLLHLMGDLDRPDRDSGAIAFDGESLSAMTLRQRNLYRNRSIGFVFQFYHLLPELNVLENTLLPGLVGSGIRADRDRARELLSTFGLDHRLTHRPRELSGGERQRGLLVDISCADRGEDRCRVDVDSRNRDRDRLRSERTRGSVVGDGHRDVDLLRLGGCP